MTNDKKRQIKSHCPNCGSGKTANVVASYEISGEDENTGIWGKTSAYILQCGGCEAVFFHEASLCSEDTEPDGRPIERITVYPAPAKRKRPEWFAFSLLELDRSLHSLLNETYNALDVDARVLAATGARTVFDRASELLKINPALTFKEKLDLLEKSGHISASERAHLDILTDAGSAAAHRGWKPTTAQLDTIMTIIETFIHRKFILESKVKRLKSQIPRRKKRTKSKP